MLINADAIIFPKPCFVRNIFYDIYICIYIIRIEHLHFIISTTKTVYMIPAKMYFKYVYLLLWPFAGRKIVLKFESQKETKSSHYFIQTLYALER